MGWISVTGHMIFLLSLAICLIIGEAIIIFKLLSYKEKTDEKKEDFISILKHFWGSFIIYVIATSIIASFISKTNIALNDMNTWVSLILGMVALIIGIISLFLSFYNVDQSVQAQKETLDIIQRFKEDMIDKMHLLQKDIENKIETSSKETREELKGKLNQSIENRVNGKPDTYNWEDEE